MLSVMSKKNPQTTKRIQNKRASFDFDLGDEYVAGLVLTGKETKSLRLGHGHIRRAYVSVVNGELYLLNATITGFDGVKLDEQEQTRTRKLLLKKREIDSLIEAKKQGKSIVAKELLTKGRYIKLKISVGVGRKKYDKRQVIKKRDMTRDSARELST